MGLSASLVPSHQLGRQLVWGLFFAGILAAWGLLFVMQPGLDLPAGWQDLGSDYLASLCRPPSAKELQLSLAHLSAAKDRNAAMEDIAWAILNKTEFLFQH